MIFEVSVIEVEKTISNCRAGNHLSGQLVRSGTAPALLYGEAQSGESKKDFIHKLQIILNELRETMICLKIIRKAKLYKNEEGILNLIKECNELISRFVKSVETAKKNMIVNKIKT